MVGSTPFMTSSWWVRVKTELSIGLF